MNDRDRHEDEHIITVESTQIHRGQVSEETSEMLTSDYTKPKDIYGREHQNESVALQFVEEIKIIYRCSCGKRFRKGHTAREHLEGDYAE